MGICVYTCRYQVWLLVLIKVDENINSFLAGTMYYNVIYPGAFL